MAREGCIAHPPGLFFVQRRPEYLGITDNDNCAAELLALFEFWTNCRIGVGDVPDQIWLHEDMSNIRQGLLYGYSEKIVRRASCLLESKGLVKRAKLSELVRLGVMEGTGNEFKDRWVQDWLYQFQVSAVQTAVNYWFRSSNRSPSAHLPNLKQEGLEAVSSTSQPEVSLAVEPSPPKNAETLYPMQSADLPEHFGRSADGENDEKVVLSPETLYPMQSADLPEHFGRSADYLKESYLRKNLERERDQDRSRVRRKKLIIRTGKAEQPCDQTTGDSNTMPDSIPVEPSKIAQDECSAAENVPIFDKTAYDWTRYRKAGSGGSDPRFLKYMCLRTQEFSARRVAAGGKKVDSCLSYALAQISKDGVTFYGDFERESGLVEQEAIAPEPELPLIESIPEPELLEPEVSTPAKSKRKPKAAKPPKEPKYSEAFMRWWGTELGFKDIENGWYYWALSVGASAGSTQNSWKAWQKLFGDGEPTEEFVQGDRAFREWRTEEYLIKGQAIGVPNGERYIPAHYKRKEALDRPAALRTPNSALRTPNSELVTTFDPNNIAFVAALASRYLPDLPGFKAPVTIATAKATITDSRMAAKIQVFWDEWQRSHAPEAAPASQPADLPAGSGWQDELKIRQNVDIVAVYANQQGEYVVHLPNDCQVPCEELRSLPTWEAVKDYLAKAGAARPIAPSTPTPNPEVIDLRAEISKLEADLHVGAHQRSRMTRLCGSASGILNDMGLDLLKRYRDDLRDRVALAAEDAELVQAL